MTNLVLLGGAVFFVFLGHEVLALVYVMGCFVGGMDDTERIVFLSGLLAAMLFQSFFKASGGKS